MQHTNWREIVEIVGIVSIVTALLLVALELRQANRLTRAELELEIANAFAEVHLARLENPELAQLFPKIRVPQAHLITATDASRMEALARHHVGNLWSAQVAFDNGVIDRDDLDHYIALLDTILEDMPGLLPHMLDAYRAHPDLAGKAVFAPLAERDRAAAPPAGAPAEKDGDDASPR